jgi:dolichol kinase
MLVSSLALVIQHANCILSASYYIVICGMSTSAIYFFTLSYKRYNFRKNLLKINMFFDFIYKFVCKISQHKKNSTKCYHIFT